MVQGASRTAFPGSAGVSPAARQNPAGGARWHARGYLPHFEGGEIPQVVTFRLADSFPRARLEQWRQELACLPEKQACAELRKRMEACLDSGIGHCWLRDARVAEVVEQALLYSDGSHYRLHAWVLMPNHVHVLFTPIQGYTLSGILHNGKSFTAKEANRILGRRGVFWQRESFDRYVRDARHLRAAVAYIEMNPVKAGLCIHAGDWRFGSARRAEAGETPALPGSAPRWV